MRPEFGKVRIDGGSFATVDKERPSVSYVPIFRREFTLDSRREKISTWGSQKKVFGGTPRLKRLS